MHTLNQLAETLKNLKAQTSDAAQICQPVFFRISNPQEHAELNKVLALPGIAVFDEIENQLSELLKLRQPSHRLSKVQLDVQVKAYLKDTPVHEYGVWVFYPWSLRLVHILDKEEFIEVRTSRNQYKITPEERVVLSSKKIGVIGLSVGQSVSVTMAMERIGGELRLADFDALELTNLNRIRTGVHNLGLLKVHSVAREIAEIDPFIKVVCFPQGLTEDNMDQFFTGGGKLDLLVEESDGFDIKVLSRYKARELKVPVIMEASDRCMVDVERFDLEPERKILHGILDHLDVAKLKTLTSNEEKIPYMFDILGLKSTSAKLRASMLEMQQTITTWPQLASAVTMGGGITADVSRRILLNDFNSSGRFYVDVEELIGDTGKKSSYESQPADEISIDQMFAQVALLNPVVSNTSDKDLAEIVKAAALAPSIGNLQPWTWFENTGGLYLFRDKSAGLQLLDKDGTNDFLGLGAAIENAMLKAGTLGYETNLNFFPLKGSLDLIAELRFEKSKSTTEEPLANYIEQRQTNRSFSKRSEINPLYYKEIEEVIKRFDGLEIRFLKDEKIIDDLSGVFANAERIRILEPQLHAELFSKELNLENSRDKGVNIAELAQPSAMNTALTVVSAPEVAAQLLEWQKGTAFRTYHKDLISNSSAIGLICSRGNSRQEILQAGRAMERIWLSCTKNSLAFHPICLPLALSKHLENRELAERIFTGESLRDLQELKVRLTQSFGIPEVKNGVFLFRLTQADKPNARSFRKPLSKVYFSSLQKAK